MGLLSQRRTAASVFFAVSSLAVSINTSPAGVRMTLTHPTKVGRVDGDNVFGDGGDSALGDGLRPLLHRRGAIPEPLEKLVMFH
jgi:hypothetical protein